jgi:hypothetical protein
MAALIIWAALHWQILAVPVFKPNLELIRGHEIVETYAAPRDGELQPNGAELQWRMKW